MRSGLEHYAAAKVSAFWASIRSRDRAVLLGAALSVVPMFPACFFGVILSLGNLVLIHKGVASQSEARLVKISLAIGFLNSVVWLYLFFVLGEFFGFFLGNIIDIILSPLSGLDANPIDRAPTQDVIL